MYLLPIAFCRPFDSTYEDWTELAGTIVDQRQFIWILASCCILKKRGGETIGKTTHLFMCIVHRKQQLTSTMNLRKDVGTQMPGQPIRDEIATVLPQQYLYGKFRNATRLSYTSQQEIVVVDAAGQHCIRKRLSKIIPILPQNRTRKTFGQILFPRHKD